MARLFFIPAAQSPFKPDTSPAPVNQRLRLLRLALAGQTRYEIDEQEVRRGGISYTIDTVHNYVKRFPQGQLYYLIGADHIAQLPKWRAAEELARLVEFIVIPRPDQPPGQLQPPFRQRTLAGFPLAVSSSQVRARIKAGQSIELLVPSAVAEAIGHDGLYREGADGCRKN